MANEVWRGMNARCPHYVRSNATCITCSASGKENDEIRRRLPDAQSCSKWFRDYCSRHYSLCLCCQIIDKVLEADAEHVGRGDH